jgi:hypothetical protein
LLAFTVTAWDDMDASELVCDLASLPSRIVSRAEEFMATINQEIRMDRSD